MNAVASEPHELLTELRVLCARLPVPQPSWHPYVPELAACRGDFERALERAAEQPSVLERVAALLDGDAAPVLDTGASPDLTAAWRRLEALPRPGGQHPYLGEILPALDALRLLLVALSRTTG